jgi:hypothetical protein
VVLQPTAEDRLLSAIEYCTNALLKVGNVQSLELLLLFPSAAHHFISRSSQAQAALLRQCDADSFLKRKERGEALLKDASTKLALKSGSKPIVRILSTSPVGPQMARGFRSILAAVIREAERYGWTVDQILRDPLSWQQFQELA